MAAPSLADAFLVGVDILRTTISSKTKRILAQIGSVTGKTTDADNVEWVQHSGWVSLPPEPEAGKAAAQGWGIRQGGTDFIFASQDARGLALAGQLKPGEFCAYAPGADGKSQGRILGKQDGSVHIFTKEGNVEGGKGIAISVGSDGAISIASSEGNAVLLGADGSVKVFNASGALQIKPDGHVKIASGSKVEISGASITLGGPAALPLAVGPQVVAAISALQTQISSLATSLVAVAAAAALAPGASGAVAAAAPVAGAVGSGAAAVSAASALIPTKRTSGD